MEEWRDIPGYEGRYQISNLARVKSLKRNGKKNGQEYFLTHTLNKGGYYRVGIMAKVKTVHRLLMLTFVPNPNNLPAVNHKNGIKTDNRLENLEWCTNKHNNRHAIQIGLKGRPWHRGEKHFNCKLNQKIVEHIRSKTLRNKEYCDLYGIGSGHVSRLQNNLNYWKP